MNKSSPFALKGVVPSICDAEAGHERAGELNLEDYGDTHDGGPDPVESADFPAQKLRSVMAELCLAVRSALNHERDSAEDRLRRASELLEEIGSAGATARNEIRGGLAAWQIRKVTHHIEAHLDGTIRNEELAALVRLTPSHFGRAFRNSVGEPPHEYVIRRRIERAQGLMLSTNAKLSEIALNCGLADQSHLTRLFRRLVGESPRAWRRARISA
jgi:AraC-like DNA-binding protein